MSPTATASGTLMVDDYDQEALKNRLNGNFGVVADGGEIRLDFEKIRDIANLSANSAAKITYDIDAPGYGFLWIKLGPVTETQGSTGYLDLRDYGYLSFKYRGEEGADFKIEIHEDTDNDRRYQYGRDRSSPLYLSHAAKIFPLQDGWKKAVISLPRFHIIKDWSKALELVFVFEKDRTGESGELFFDEILFGKSPLNFRMTGPHDREIFQSVRVSRNQKEIRTPVELSNQNHFEIHYTPGKDFPLLESVEIQLKPKDDPHWYPLAGTFDLESGRAVFDWEAYSFSPPKDFSLRFVAKDVYGNSYQVAGPFENLKLPAMSNEEFLDLVERKAFLYFLENQNEESGLFLDTSWGGDASIAVTGFGLTALVIGAERGWIPKAEAAARSEKCLNTLLEKAEEKGGFFYHFLHPVTAERIGTSEISTVDTALFLTGAITAAEYFQGPVQTKAETIYRNVNWPEFLNQNESEEGYLNFYHGWTPEEGMSDYVWDFYTDEVLIVALLAIGSPTHPVSPETFYRFTRRKGSYAGGEEFIYSWHGAMFSYQYAHPWFNLKDITDKEGVNWWKNATRATLANRDYVMNQSGQYKTYGPDTWGITSMRIPERYIMHFGGLPNGQEKAIHDGTISPSGPGGSITFTPYLSLRVLKHLYQKYPEIWGHYGLKDSINLDREWVSPIYYGLGEGLMVIMLENFRSGLVWEYFMKNAAVQTAMKKAGFEEAGEKTEVGGADPEKIKQELNSAVSKWDMEGASSALNQVQRFESLKKLYDEFSAKKGEKNPGNQLILALLKTRMLAVLEGHDLKLGRRYIKEATGLAESGLSHFQKALDLVPGVPERLKILKQQIDLLEQVQDETGLKRAVHEFSKTLLEGLKTGGIELGTVLQSADEFGGDIPRDLHTEIFGTLDKEEKALLLDHVRIRAEAAMESEDYHGASALYREHLELMKKVVPMEEVLTFIDQTAETFLTAGRPAEAEWYYRKILATGETQDAEEKIRYRLAGILESKEDKQGAIREYKKFLKTFRKSDKVPEIYMKIARLESGLGRKKVAVQTFQRVMRQYPDLPLAEEALYLIGMMYFQERDYERAIATWEEFRQKYPDSKRDRTVLNYLEKADMKQAMSQ